MRISGDGKTPRKCHERHRKYFLFVRAETCERMLGKSDGPQYQTCCIAWPPSDKLALLLRLFHSGLSLNGPDEDSGKLPPRFYYANRGLHPSLLPPAPMAERAGEVRRCRHISPAATLSGDGRGDAPSVSQRGERRFSAVNSLLMEPLSPRRDRVCT